MTYYINKLCVGEVSFPKPVLCVLINNTNDGRRMMSSLFSALIGGSVTIL